MNNQHIRRVLLALNLPEDLIELLRDGRLEDEVQRCYEEHDHLNALMDEWELKNPQAYRESPWYDERERWKACGRPRPPWYELLAQRQTFRSYRSGHQFKRSPLTNYELDINVLGSYRRENLRRWRAKQKRST